MMRTSTSTRRKRSKSRTLPGPPCGKAFSEAKTKGQLIELIKEFAKSNPEVRERLEDQAGLSKGSVGRMVKSIRQEIRELSSEPGWSNYWKEEGYTPDYSRVKKRLETLLAHGHADEVVRLGQELLEAGTRQVEISHDEGETGIEISSCLDVVFQSLLKSSLSPVDQMLWAIDAEIKDEYTLCECLGIFRENKHSKSDWSKLADVLLSRLKEFPSGKGGDAFSRDYRRDILSDWIIRALKEAGRHEEVVPLCEGEAEKTGSYERLVKYLMEAKRWKEAEGWIHEGIRATEKRYPSISAKLRESLKQIRAKAGDWMHVAALEADEFLRDPSLEAYKALRKAATKAAVWPVVKDAVMKYLETGKLWRKEPSWPLPEAALGSAGPRRKPRFPVTDALIDIAIAERKPDEVLRWHNASKSDGPGWGYSRDERVAKAVVTEHPDRSISIWKRLAENQIGQTNPRAYQAAATYLKRIP